MDTQNLTTPLQRLQYAVERIGTVLEIAGAAMKEMPNTSEPRIEPVKKQWIEMMESIVDIQTTLREEIKKACEYRRDYVPGISIEICCKKLEDVIAQGEEMRQTIQEFKDAA